MLAKGLAVSAAQMVGTHFVENGANRAMQSLPKPKQNKIKGILMMASAVMLFVSGLKLVKKV